MDWKDESMNTPAVLSLEMDGLKHSTTFLNCNSGVRYDELLKAFVGQSIAALYTPQTIIDCMREFIGEYGDKLATMNTKTEHKQLTE